MALLAHGARRPDVDVLVVGAGPTGLLLACELARRGVSHRVIDRKAGCSTRSKALVLQARSLEILEPLGLIDTFLEEGQPMDAVRMRIDGDTAFRIDLSGIPSPYPFPLVLGQERTEALLLERLLVLGSDVEWEVELADVRQDEHMTRAALRHADGTVESVEARYVVGCDGAHSTVRKRTGMAFDGFAYPETFMLADVDVDWTNQVDEVTFMLREDRGVIAFPIHAEGRFRLVVLDVDPSDPEGGDPTLAEVQAQVDRVIPGEARLHDAHWTARYRVHCRCADAFRDGRIFLAGDAAHIHSPAGGQGMNTGLQDAHNLAWKLAAVLEGQGGESLLESYHAERYPVAQRLLNTTDRAFQVALARSPWTRFLRNNLFPLVARTQRFQTELQRLVSQVAIRYPESPAVQDDRTRPGWAWAQAQPRIGQRAPDGRMRDPRRGPIRLLGEALGTDHVLLLFSAGTRDQAQREELAEMARLIQDRLGSHVQAYWIEPQERLARGSPEPPAAAPVNPVGDPGGHLHDRYGAASPTAWLVRPDAHLGYALSPPDRWAFQTFLDRVYPATKIWLTA